MNFVVFCRGASILPSSCNCTFFVTLSYFFHVSSLVYTAENLWLLVIYISDFTRYPKIWKKLSAFSASADWMELTI